MKKECCQGDAYTKFAFLETSDPENLICCNAPCKAMEAANCTLTSNPKCAPSARYFRQSLIFDCHYFVCIAFLYYSAQQLFFLPGRLHCTTLTIISDSTMVILIIDSGPSSMVLATVMTIPSSGLTDTVGGAMAKRVITRSTTRSTGKRYQSSPVLSNYRMLGIERPRI